MRLLAYTDARANPPWLASKEKKKNKEKKKKLMAGRC